MYAFLFILLLFKSCVFGAEEARLNATQKEAVREYVRHFLSMPDLPAPDGGAMPADGSGRPDGSQTSGEKQVQFPRHMLELYQSRRQAAQGAQGRQVPEGRETIRSIEPMKGNYFSNSIDILCTCKTILTYFQL